MKAMLLNLIKSGFRNLKRNSGYSAINILGLAVGLASFSFIMLYVKGELGYDSWQEKGDRIYRMALERKYPGRSRFYAIIPNGFSQVVAQDIPEVEETCRLFYFNGNTTTIKKDGNLYVEDNFMWADSTFFDLFSIPLLEGDAKKALSQPRSVIITQRIAKKYFGDADPMGQILDVANNDNDFKVTGVCADLPENTHLSFDFLIASADLGAFIQQPNFVGFSAYTYLLLKPGADPAAVESKLPDIVVKYASGQILQNFGVDYATYQAQGNGYRYFLQNLPDIHLKSNLESEIKAPGSLKRVQFFILIALLILLIAVINFMNLTTAKSASRAREVGIRKTMGSSRGALAGQFFTEAILVSLISGILALGINFLALSGLNVLTGKTFTYQNLMSWSFLGMLFGASLVTGLISGTYPATYLSSFKPIDAFRAHISTGVQRVILRNALVVLQFSISVFLIIATILFYNQLKFSQNQDLGFDKENLLNISGGFNLEYQEEETFKKELRQLSGVVAVSGCNNQPGDNYFGMSFKPMGADETTTGSGLIIDDGYVECMDMKILQGRSFSEQFTDSLNVVVNQAAVREMGLQDPIGTTLTSSDNFLNPVEGTQSVYTIIGVIEDFHFQSFHHQVTPLFLIHNTRSFRPGVDGVITVRLAGGNVPATVETIRKMWNKLAPETPFSYTFLDDDWSKLYTSEMTMRKVFGVFCLIAIFIACLGLFALAAYTIEKRTKEIGIRKVLGASEGTIVGLLSKDFLKLVFIAIVLASPIAWYVMHQWLQGFAYRISIHWWVFLIAGGSAVLIAFLTVSFQSIKAAINSPIQSLRSE